MKIGVIGCGWLGQRLGLFLKENHTIITTNRTQKKANAMTEKGFISFSVDFFTEDFNEQTQQKLNECDVLIISVSVRSKLRVFENITRFLKENTAKQILFLSTVGIYKNSPENIKENTPWAFLKSPFKEVEQTLQTYFPKINILRLGGLFGDDRVFIKYFSHEKTICNVPVNHIHYKDVCAIVEKLISLKVVGKVYNLVAPVHPTKKEIIKNQKEKYKISAQMLPKTQCKEFKIVSSDKVIKELDYIFLYPNPIYF